MLKIAQKNAAAHNGLHICRQCQLKANNPAKRKEVQAKMKATCIKRYGTELPLNSQENIEKRREQFQNEEFKQQWVEKHRQTLLERYGVEHQMHLDQTKEKIKNTCLERYGVGNARQAEESKQKSKETCLEKHGVEFTGQIPGTREQASDTMKERYGVRHYNELPEMQDYLREHCREWLAESWANPWAKGITRPEEWNHKQRETVTNLMMAGEWRAGYPQSKKGFCYPKKCKKDKVYFRSSYEAIYCYYLSQNQEVDCFSFEAFRIPYHYEGKPRFYVPDFIIHWTNGSVSIHELKAEFLKEDAKTLAKQEAGTLFAQQQGITYELLTNDFMDSLDITFEQLKEMGFIQ